MKQPIFYFQRLKAWDIWTILIYSIISLIVFYKYKASVGLEDHLGFVIPYAIVTQIFIYIVNYKSLRNFSVYLIWIIFGLLHFAAYLDLKEDALLQTGRISSVIPLRNTIVLLLVFQVLRIISLNIQRQDFVVPTRSGTTDIFGERKVTMLDSFLFIVYVGTFLGLMFLK